MRQVDDIIHALLRHGIYFQGRETQRRLRIIFLHSNLTSGLSGITRDLRLVIERDRCQLDLVNTWQCRGVDLERM